MHTKCRFAVDLEPILYVKFAIRFSISPKIAVSRENLGGADNFFPTGWLRGAGKILLHRRMLKNIGERRPC